MRKLIVVGMLGLLLAGTMAFADIPTPEEAVMLTVSGTIALRNVGDEFHFDMNMLQELPYVEYEVDDPWLSGTQEYRGVKLQTILEYVGYPAEADRAVIVAADDMRAPVQVEHAVEYPIMIAYQLNGEAISSGRGGPLKLVFPYQYEEVQELYTHDMWAWFVVRLQVEY